MFLNSYLNIPLNNIENKIIDKKLDYHQLFLDNSDLDLKKLIFAKELENISKYGAIDYDLNINLHKYKEINTDLYNGYKLLDNNGNSLVEKVKNPLLNGGGIKGKRKQDLNLNLIKSPRKIYDFMEMRDYIKDRFMKFTWDDIKFENNCEEKKIIIKSINKIIYIIFTTFVLKFFNNCSIIYRNYFWKIMNIIYYIMI